MSRMKLSAAARQYQLARRSEWAPSSRRHIRDTLCMFEREVGPNLLVTSLRRSHIEKWMSAQQVSPSSLRTRLSVVKTFTRWLVDSDLAGKDPCRGIKGPRQPVAMPRELDQEAVKSVLRAVPDLRGQLVVLLAVQEGLRRAEIAGLTRENIDLDGGLMLVHGKGNVERWLPISTETRATMRAYIGEQPGLVGPVLRSISYPNRGITPGYVGKMVSDWMREAGVKDHAYDGRSTHALRHTFAGTMIDCGADVRDVQQALGHRDLATVHIYLRRRAATTRLREVMGQQSYL